MKLRPAVETDVPRLTSLSEQLGYPSTEAEVRERLAAIRALPDHAVLVADDGGRVQGWIHVHRSLRIESGPVAEIGGLVVDAAVRGTGVGSQLLEAAEAWAAAQGLPAVRLRSNVVRTEAHGFYRRRGYEVGKTSLNFRKGLSGAVSSRSGT